MREKARKTDNRGFGIVSSVILALYSLTIIFAFVWIVYSSFKSVYEFSENYFGLPHRWILDNFKAAFSDFAIPIGTRKVFIEEMVWNSILYAFLYSFIPVFSNMMVAYICAKYRSVITGIIYNVVIFLMVMPVLGNLSSGLKMSMVIGTYDNIPFAALTQFQFGGTGFLIMYAVFKGVSWEYAEAALVDGAGHFRILFQIMLPMAKATAFALWITSFIGVWNDWQTPLIWFPSYPTVSYGLYFFSNSSTSAGGNTMAGIPVQFACCVLSAIPMIVLFVIFRDKIIGNMSFGGLKG